MKKKDFVTLIMSAAGLPVLPAMLLVRRKMDGKPAIVFNGKGKTRRRAGGANGGRQTYRQAVMDRLFDPCRGGGMGQFF